MALRRRASAVQHPRGDRHARRREHLHPAPAAGCRPHVDAHRNRNPLSALRRSPGHPSSWRRAGEAPRARSLRRRWRHDRPARRARLRTVRSPARRPFLGLGTVIRKEFTEWVRGPKALIILGLSVLGAIFMTLIPFIAEATKEARRRDSCRTTRRPMCCSAGPARRSRSSPSWRRWRSCRPSATGHPRLDADQSGLAHECHLREARRRVRVFVATAVLLPMLVSVGLATVVYGGLPDLRVIGTFLGPVPGAARVLHHADRRAGYRRQVDGGRGRHRVRGAVPPAGHRRPAADRERALTDVDRFLGDARRQGRAGVDAHADRLGDLDGRPARRGQAGVRSPGAVARPLLSPRAGRMPGAPVRRLLIPVMLRPVIHHPRPVVGLSDPAHRPGANTSASGGERRYRLRRGEGRHNGRACDPQPSGPCTGCALRRSGSRPPPFRARGARVGGGGVSRGRVRERSGAPVGRSVHSVHDEPRGPPATPLRCAPSARRRCAWCPRHARPGRRTGDDRAKRWYIESMSQRYDPSTIEPKWQRYWEEHEDLPRRAAPGTAQGVRARHVPVPVGRRAARRPPRGLHGDRHRRALRAHARLRRAASDGLGRVRPARRAARDQDRHAPARDDAEEHRRPSGASSRCSASATTGRARSTRPIPATCSWTQWIFLQLFKRGPRVPGRRCPVNWCPALGTVLANEEVSRRQERARRPPGRDAAAPPVDAPDHRSTPTASLEDLAHARLARDEGQAARLDRPQRRRERRLRRRGPRGAKHHASSRRASTRSPARRTSCSRPSTRSRRQIVSAAQQRGASKPTSTSANAQERHRSAPTRRETKTGVATGAFAINPINGDKVPVWVADYVIGSYGTGAVMAVPAHDERDHAFAVKYEPPDRPASSRRPNGAPSVDVAKAAFTDDGVANDAPSRAARRPSTKGMPSERGPQRRSPTGSPRKGKGAATVTYKLRDWVFSRQRYWGEPIPIYFPVDVRPATRASRARSSRFTTTSRSPSTRASCRCCSPTSRTSSRATIPRARSRARSTGASSRRTASGSRARPTRCRSGRARAGTTCASSIRRTPTAALRARGLRRVDAGRPLRRRRRARGAPPPLRALLAQGALRPRAREARRAVHEARPPGDDPR